MFQEVGLRAVSDAAYRVSADILPPTRFYRPLSLAVIEVSHHSEHPIQASPPSCAGHVKLYGCLVEVPGFQDLEASKLGLAVSVLSSASRNEA